MAIQKYVSTGETASVSSKRLSLPSKSEERAQLIFPHKSQNMEPDMDVDLREIYFLMLRFLSSGPCERTYKQFCNELDEHQLLPRRYHAWYSRSGLHSGHEDDDGMSFPLSYNELVERYSHIKEDHMVKLLKQLLLNVTSPSWGISSENSPNASDVPTLLGRGSFSLLSYDRDKTQDAVKSTPAHMRWPHVKADQVRGLSLREIGGGFPRHHRAPSVRAACYAIAKPATMLQKMQNIKRLRGHRNAVYCATFDHSGRYVITGSDDRLVKIWSMEAAYCLASCRGHDGDITDLAVSSNDTLVASSSNDCVIRIWRLPDGLPISVLRGHTGAVTAIAFSPRPGAVYQLLSSSDDGTCRIWDARNSLASPRIFVPRPSDFNGGKSGAPSSSAPPPVHQIFCCSFNVSGTVFVTGSSDHLARVWNACKPIVDVPDQPNHEIDVLAGHENDVNYVQFSGCGVASRFTVVDNWREENIPKFKNSWFNHDNIVTCSRDGSAIIWIPKSRRSHGKAGRWIRAYHLRVPPPPMPSQPQRGGPRQRILPTPRGVNMIVWSLDNRFVLAAIMDCRICVWNATDGSLVHSLTGHTESTYVLDVHPFNPRIAMSAGYDGKTIVWDIWEGTPIRVYEISRFKLVDGKFSSDGTSIILSDDVGQLYILNTGQGESQNGAKYDQFFLGDYRPLIQDTNGNVLDQETQLIPYRRNMQDLLCDAAMIPYPEPYQSEYQKRRLGALGIDWRPPSLKLAVGPDFSLDPEYQMLPLADLDMIAEPLPEFIDAMDWEPENEVRTEDTDSEYNITEDYSSGGEQGSLDSNASGKSHCSTEDSEAVHTQLDSRRKSKRKKHKSEIEIVTSSGRRVKRKNLDECDGSDGNSIKIPQIRKARSGQNASKRKSSVSMSSRPQRAAARNALSLFSKITGVDPQTDGEYEDSLEGDTSDSESTLQESNIESDDSVRDLQNERTKLKGKALSLDDSEDNKPCELRETHMNSTNRRKIILKLSSRDSSKPFFDGSIEEKSPTQADLGASSSKASQRSKENQTGWFSCQDSDFDVNFETVDRTLIGKFENVKNNIGFSDGSINMDIRWGGAKARTTKRLKMVDPCQSHVPLSSSPCDESEKENTDVELREADATLKELPTRNDQRNLVKVGSVTFLNTNGTIAESCNGVVKDKNYVGQHTCGVHNIEAQSTSASNYVRDDCSYEKASSTLMSPRKGSDSHPVDPKSPAQQEASNVDIEQKPVVLDDGSLEREILSHEEIHDTDFKAEVNVVSQDSVEMHPRKDKMYNAVYSRSKSHKAKANVADHDIEASSSRNKKNLNSWTSFKEGTSDVGEPKANSCDSDHMANNLISQQQNGHAVNGADNGSIDNEQTLQKDWSLGLRPAVRLRSTRIKKVNYHIQETSPVCKKTSTQSGRKGSWLMLSTQEEGCRYIPQLGDEVVYLRQGHKEYIQCNASRESVPWMSLKGEIRVVEYCRVEKLEYSTAPSGDGSCKLTLQFTDPTSSVFGKCFRLTLPDVIDLPDFLVERTRFDDAMQRNWTRRDKCRIWWKEAGSDGKWWEGRILSVQAKTSEFPDSPWDSCKVLYKDEPTNGVYFHSPWELFDADSEWEQPRIPAESRDKLLSALSKLNQPSMQDRYGVQELKKVCQKTKFINRFPVPLTLELIQSRLENNYYRSLEAVKHDICVMLSNFKSYFEREVNIAAKLRRLSEWLTRTLSSL